MTSAGIGSQKERFVPKGSLYSAFSRRPVQTIAEMKAVWPTAECWLLRARNQLQSPFPMLRFSTAGESHGEALVALLSGMPAGLAVDLEFVNRELWRRQQGYGRGGRMRIERDAAHILSGVRHGKTIGSPIAILLANKDWQNWTEALPVEEGDPAKHKRVASPRPGHADLAGALKYNFSEARYVLERASARESAARVAAGAIAKLLLREFGIEVLSHVIAVGNAGSMLRSHGR